MSRPLPTTMLAGILHGQQDVRMERCSVPVPGPGEVLLRVEAALTDGTDLKVFRRGYHARMITPPARFGHEYAGHIAAVGTGVNGWVPGDRVVGANSAPCGACFHCIRREESLCEDLIFVNGAYAEYMLLPDRVVQRNMLRIPEKLPAAEAALMEPLACVIKGIRDTGISAGDVVAIIGSGPIGLMAARVASLGGANVILVGRRQAQLDLGKALGAWLTIGPEIPADIPAALKDLTSSRGPDRVFEATGAAAMWEQAIQSVRRGGIVNLFGGCPAGVQVCFDANRLHYDQITICSSFHHTPDDIRQALALIAQGQVPAGLFFDGCEPLGDLPRVLCEMNQRRRVLKTVIKPDADSGDYAALQQ